MSRSFFSLLGMFVIGAIVVVSCASSGDSLPRDVGNGPRFVLELVPGKTYATTTKWFVFDVPIYPQVAAWVETKEGRYLGTIFVTAKTESGSFIEAPRDGRPESLPLWSHLRSSVPDAVSGATQAGSTVTSSDLAATLSPGTYVVKLETNRSYDWNDAYPASLGVVGQPSLVYRTEITVGDASSRAEFIPVGTGSVDGSHGGITPGLDGIDGALALFSSMSVSFRL